MCSYVTPKVAIIVAEFGMPAATLLALISAGYVVRHPHRRKMLRVTLALWFLTMLLLDYIRFTFEDRNDYNTANECASSTCARFECERSFLDYIQKGAFFRSHAHLRWKFSSG